MARRDPGQVCHSAAGAGIAAIRSRWRRWNRRLATMVSRRWQHSSSHPWATGSSNGSGTGVDQPGSSADGDGTAGGVPVSWLLPTEKARSDVKPDSDGSAPTRVLSYKSTPITCPLPLSQVMPDHVHSVPAAPSQPLLLVQLAPWVLLKRSTSTWRCEAGICAKAGSARVANASVDSVARKNFRKRVMISSLNGQVRPGNP